MKRIKAMLAGIAVLAVVGSVFAFKAKSAFGQNIFYTTTNTYKAVTPVEKFGVSYTTMAPAPTLTVLTTSVYYTTATSTILVPTKAFLAQED